MIFPISGNIKFLVPSYNKYPPPSGRKSFTCEWPLHQDIGPFPLSSEIVLALHPDGSLPVGAHSIAGEGRQQDEDGDHLDHKSAREGTQQGRRVRSFTTREFSNDS